MKNAIIRNTAAPVAVQREWTPALLALALGVAAVSTVTFSPVSRGAETLQEAVTGGKVAANVRLRYEDVSDDAAPRDAEALTVRTRLGYETATFAGFSVGAEFEDTHTVLGVDDYAPENPGYAVIADPAGSELNRAYLRYQGIAKLDMAWGRQRINYGNQRFIGAVGWRQDDQTFDGFTAAYTGIDKLVVNYAYLTQVNGITDAFDSDDISDNLLHLSYSGLSLGNLSAYAFLLDHGDETDATVNPGLRFDSSDTLGIRFDGAWAVPDGGGLKILYAAEYAHQAFDNTARTQSFDADYTLLEAGVSVPLDGMALTAKLSREVLGSDGGNYGFQTPFATKHAFNGWADKFLVTPAAGLRDIYATLGLAFPSQGINLLTVYHQYDADQGSGDFGSEWNLQAVKVFNPTVTVGVKYSAYDGEDLPYRDTSKLWLWGEVNF